jgi:alpha-L-fucosidase
MTVIMASAVVWLLGCQLLFAFSASAEHYKPTWDSLDARPLPAWYDDAKIGIFIHWGVFSVPSFVDEWFWDYWKGPHPNKQVVEYMAANYKPDFTYADFAKDFTAEFFDPYSWAEIFNASGAK